MADVDPLEIEEEAELAPDAEVPAEIEERLVEEPTGDDEPLLEAEE